MPDVALAPSPPPAFDAACARWAAGTGTEYDHAVLTSLTTQTALPEPFDPVAVGFHPSTRLPSADALPLFHAAKDEARAAFHAASTRARAAALSDALSSPAGSAIGPFPAGLGAAPARKGLAEAAAHGLGKPHAVTWAVVANALVAAGPGFVAAAKAGGWNVRADEETGGEMVVWQAGEGVSDGHLVRMAVECLRGVEREVIAAGEVGVSNVLRKPGVRARGLGLMWLWGRIRVGTMGKGIWKRRRKQRERMMC